MRISKKTSLKRTPNTDKYQLQKKDDQKKVLNLTQIKLHWNTVKSTNPQPGSTNQAASAILQTPNRVDISKKIDKQRAIKNWNEVTTINHNLLLNETPQLLRILFCNVGAKRSNEMICHAPKLASGQTLLENSHRSMSFMYLESDHYILGFYRSKGDESPQLGCDCHLETWYRFRQHCKLIPYLIPCNQNWRE